MPEKANKLEGGNKTHTPKTQEGVNTLNSISRYESQALSLERQIAEINDSKKENTDMAGGIGDWIGEKTGAYETGKSIYEDQIKQTHARAKDLFTKISSDLQTGKIGEADKSKIQSIIAKLEKVLGAKLEEVSWGDAAMNDINKGLLKGSKPVEYAVRGAYGAGEGAYDMVVGIAEITGKAMGIFGAFVIEPEARTIIKEDLNKVLSVITYENAKKVLALLPGALEKFSQLPPEKQVEGAAKFVGTFLIPIGIGGKVIDASASIGKAGMQTAKTGARTMAETSTKIAKELNATGKVTMQTAKEGARAMVESSAMFVGGTTELGLAGAGVVGGTAVRYVGEFGAGGKKKMNTGKISKEGNLAKKIEKAETHSGISHEVVMKNAQLSPKARLEKANELLGKKLTQEQKDTILLIHNDISKGVYQNGHKELRAMVEKLDSVGISRKEGRKLMENGVLGIEFNMKASSWEEVHEIIAMKLTGKGKIINPDLYTREGHFIEGEISGLGKITYPNGRVMEGVFEEGFLIKGKTTYPNGTICEGDFLKGTTYLHGEGTKIINGTKKEGLYYYDSLIEESLLGDYGNMRYVLEEFHKNTETLISYGSFHAMDGFFSIGEGIFSKKPPISEIMQELDMLPFKTYEIISDIERYYSRIKKTNPSLAVKIEKDVSDFIDRVGVFEKKCKEKLDFISEKKGNKPDENLSVSKKDIDGLRKNELVPNTAKTEEIMAQTKININTFGLEMQEEIKERLPLIKEISKSISNNLEIPTIKNTFHQDVLKRMRRSLEDYEYYINAITVEKDFSIVSFQQMQLAESSFDKVMKLSRTFSGIHGSNIDNLVNELRNHNNMIMMNNTRIESLFRNIN